MSEKGTKWDLMKWKMIQRRLGSYCYGSRSGKQKIGIEKDNIHYSYGVISCEIEY